MMLKIKYIANTCDQRGDCEPKSLKSMLWKVHIPAVRNILVDFWTLKVIIIVNLHKLYWLQTVPKTTIFIHILVMNTQA